MDSFSEARLQEVHPALAARARRLDQRLVDSSLAVRLRVIQGLRTWNQQDTLYARGRTTAGEPCVHGGVARRVGLCQQHPLGLPVTKAKGGQSAHNFAYALDAAPDDASFSDWHPDWHTEDERWKLFLATATECGFAEGAAWRTFPDAPHLYLMELPATPDDSMRYLFREGGMAAVWAEWEGKLTT